MISDTQLIHLNLVEVLSYPRCDICPPHSSKKAKYDGKTKETGQWAYMCVKHFKEFGVGFGLGKGQRLIITE